MNRLAALGPIVRQARPPWLLIVGVLMTGLLALGLVRLGAWLSNDLRQATPGSRDPRTRLAPAGTDATPGIPAKRADETAVEELRARDLLVPVDGVTRDRLTGSFDQARGERRHEALDIMAPRGTPVHAVEAGTIAKLFWSKSGGHTIYQFDPSGRYAYYYAHLDRYADGLSEQAAISRGTLLGYVGSTGNADASAPHLHFAVFKLGPEKQWWVGEPIDPYAIFNIGSGPPH